MCEAAGSSAFPGAHTPEEKLMVSWHLLLLCLLQHCCGCCHCRLLVLLLHVIIVMDFVLMFTSSP